jgi:mRNA capping enzyme, beta chain
MLYDEGPAAVKPPPQPTQDQSFQQRSQSHGAQHIYDQSHRERHSSYGPPLQPPDQRSPQPGGSYFSLQAQSPYQNSAASAGTHSFTSPSPGPHSQLNTPRDAYAPHQQHYGSVPAQSPSMLAQPQTPGGQQYSHLTHPPAPYSNGPPQQIIYNNSRSSRELSTPTNGTSTSHSRHISPEAQYHPHPATPLRPPATFPKPLAQNQRPPLGSEHYRTYSSGSTSSLTTREPVHGHMPSPEQLRRGSIHRQMSTDRERERSISVSPKTIPRPSPLRQPSTESHLQSQLTSPMTYPPENGLSRPSPSTVVSAHSYQQTPPPSISNAPSREQQTPSQSSSTRPSPSPAGVHKPPPHLMTASPSKPIHQPISQDPPSLKRTASVISSLSASSQPARKRLRRDEIPIFARSARPNNPPRLSRGRGGFDSGQIKQEHHADTPIPTNGNAAIITASATMPAAAPPHDPTEGPWEHSILNIIPYEDLTRRICDWIVEKIGGAATPAGGAVFEIEAKLGEICDADDGLRINLPVDTETVFNKDKFKRTKFESTMNVVSLLLQP